MAVIALGLSGSLLLLRSWRPALFLWHTDRRCVIGSVFIEEVLVVGVVVLLLDLDLLAIEPLQLLYRMALILYKVPFIVIENAEHYLDPCEQRQLHRFLQQTFLTLI